MVGKICTALCSLRKGESKLCFWNGCETVGKSGGSVDQLRERKVKARDQRREVE